MKNSKISLSIFIFLIVQAVYGQSANGLGKVDKNVKKELDNVITSYFDVKDALFETNGKKASEKAKVFLAVLSKVETSKMTSPQQDFFKKTSEKIKTDVEHIEESATKIDHQRDHFETLSINVLALVKEFKANSSPVYQQYCPMAFNNKGAFWLSDEKQITNPYFGNKMPHCGSVKAEF